MKDYFSDDELKCKCGKCEFKFNPNTRKRLNTLRRLRGKPIIISSGHRCHDYNIKIGATQTHATGQAIDTPVSRKEAYLLMKHAFTCGFTGIGVSQKGDTRFLHLDDVTEGLRPTIWSY